MKKIKTVDNFVNRNTGTSGLEKKLSKAVMQEEKLKQATLKTKLAEEKVTTQKNKSLLATERVLMAQQKTLDATYKAQTAESRLTAQKYKTEAAALNLKKTTDKTVDSTKKLLSLVKKVAGVYLGIQTIKVGLTTADNITRSENMLNNLTGNDPKATQDIMDKVYAASQRSRASYNGMLHNVSKTMTLAGDSFQGNVDNAIRFQEIMAKAYTIGGASNTEAETSMYQLVQALGAGTLAGDELRSVREGAPLAYKAIEKFAQKVYETDESLKDLAADGKISAEMVTAAIMDADFSKKIDAQFAKTSMTFSQALDNIKNQLTKAFEPALKTLTQILNSKTVQGAITGIGRSLVLVGTILGWVFEQFDKFITWCGENWYWLKGVVIGVLVVLIGYMIWYTSVAIAKAAIRIGAWIAEHAVIASIILIIVALVAVIVWLAQTTKSGCEFMVEALSAVAIAILLIGIITGSVVLLIIGIIVALAAFFVKFTEEIVGGIYWFGAVCYNVGMGVANFFIACWNWIRDAGYNAIVGIGNFCIALGKSIGAICTNIGIAFNNAWHGALSGFWDFVAGCMEGLDWLAKPISKIANLFGKSFDYEDFTASIRAKADSHDSKTKEYVSVSDAWSNGLDTYQYRDLGDAWSSGMNHFEYKDLSDSYDKGAQKGAEINDKIDAFGNKIKDKINGVSDLFGSGTDWNKLTGLSDLPNPNDLNVDGAWDEPSVEELLSGVDSIKDDLDLADDDLEFLRKIADMEWRKEFTTAEIKIDMTNNNTVNGERDLDGIVAYLGDVLREEMTSVANGVHY